ncbi:MAG TPA: ATP-binding protein [Acetobacteraceae bacterium]|nr:ATP-binding protein [Acetobacteraceae bacterium]
MTEGASPNRRPLSEVRLIDRLTDPVDPALRLILEDEAAGVLVLDRALRIVRSNAAMRLLVTAAADFSPGAAVAELVAAGCRDDILQAFAAIVRGVEPHLRFSLMFAHPAAADQVVVASARPLREADGAISGLLLRLADITRQKQLEGQLAQSQKLQAVGQLAGGIAHDFNNLLTAISGAAELVLARPGLDAQITEDLTQIRGSAGRGAALVRQLLAFGRQQTLQPRVLEVNAAIRNLTDLLRRLLGEPVRLVLDLEEPEQRVRVDPTQLDQVLVNLAVNARDAMPRGGVLTLRARHATLPQPVHGGPEAVPPGRYAMIEVADTGHGIPPALLPRIFEPFFTTKRDQGGHGLGLSTVLGIIRQSGGFIALDSRPDAGTQVRVYLSRHEGFAQDEAVPERTAENCTIIQPRVERRTVLVVEDEEPVRRLAARALQQAGWQVLAAETAEAALELLHAAALPELAVVVTDMVLPGLDGPALGRRLREKMPALPCILVSGYADEALRRELMDQQMRFLPKPYALKALVALVGEAAAANPASSGNEVAKPA